MVGAFQTLNAAEARHHFRLDVDRCELVFLLPPQPRAAAETRRMIDATGWTHVREIGPPNASFREWVSRVRHARGLAAESASLRHLFLGDYQSQLGIHAATGLRDGELVALDDGMATMRINAYRRARAEGVRPRPRLQPQVRRSRLAVQDVVARRLGLDLADPDRVTFFTVYDVEPAAGDRVVRHTFEWLRGSFAAPEVVEGTLFLGSPFVESGIVTANVYREMLRRLRDVAEPPLWYRAHPRERSDHVAAFARDLKLEVLELDTVVEYAILRSGWVPATVVSNHSTTLDTLRVILGDRVTVRAVPLPIALVTRRWRPFTTMAYADLDRRLGEPVERLHLL